MSLASREPLSLEYSVGGSMFIVLHTKKRNTPWGINTDHIIEFSEKIGGGTEITLTSTYPHKANTITVTESMEEIMRIGNE
jgi:hypothetical protein